MPPPWTSENYPPAEHKRIGKMEAKEYRERLKAKMEKLEAVYDSALVNPDDRVRLIAAKQIEDRVYGQAKQVVETQDDTRSDDEIRADIERRKRELGV